MRIAIDTGGTFTDCVYLSEGQFQILKIPSTPLDPGAAVWSAVQQIAKGRQAEVRHGTTVGTNTLLERKGARVAFVTTAGFEDTIAIGRQARAELYNWFWTPEPPLAPDSMRVGVAERTGSDGTVLRALTETELARLRDTIAKLQPEAVAVSLLFSFANPENEQKVGAVLRELGVPISLSHEILPEFREYERGATVLINAYLQPKMQNYLQRLDEQIHTGGSRLHIMQSSGGIISAPVAAREPVRTILSGPAGGVVGASAVARAAGFTRILTFDMGGTSTDVALVDTEKGLQTTTESEVMGMPVAVPMLNIHTVGAGGGSLASFDRGGALKVGPESAGAVPGPICYGSGTQPTVTDANLLLGRFGANGLLGGEMRLDKERAQHYFEAAKGPLPEVEIFAEGIIRVVDAHMEKALRKISVEQGYDPREFVLVSFGGAGPLHACALARALQIPRVLVPVMPGALSAFGIFTSNVVRGYSQTVMLKPEDSSLEQHFATLESLGYREMGGEGLTPTAIRTADLRYAGQGYELTVNWDSNFLEHFHGEHERRYGYADRQRTVEVVNVRVQMIADAEEHKPQRFELQNGNGQGAVMGTKPIYFQNQQWTATVYDRERLGAGDVLTGPAIIIEYSATTFVPPHCTVKVDSSLNLVIDVPAN
ncbi:MAG: hydantoinase/oxoprolinase family protein [Bryobacteraceae bacterium]